MIRPLTLLALASLLLAAPALADVPPPNTQSCQQAQEGAACKTDDGVAGACQKQTCSRLDYSNGTPPTSKSYDCLVCVAGSPSSGDAGAGTGSKCSVSAPGRAAGTRAPAALLALLGATLLLLRRSGRRALRSSPECR